MAAAKYVTDVRLLPPADGHVPMELVSGNKIIPVHIPVRVFRMVVAMAKQYLTEHDDAGSVVEFRAH